MNVGTIYRGANSAAHFLRAWRFLAALFATLVLITLPQPANAQTVNQYTINEPGGANDINAASACPAFIVRNFVVGTSFTVSDVDLGVFATHTWRGDIQITLQSPAGTRVQLVDGDPNNVSGDNFNVRLNDEGTQIVNTDGDTDLHPATAPNPPTTDYRHNFIPNAALSAFDGQNSLGTWRMEICDRLSGFDDGNFQRADLWLTELPTNYADLSVSKSVSSATPASGTAISYTLQVTNAASSPQTATGVVVNDLLPAGVTFVGATGFGSYNDVTGDWAVGTIAPGQTRTLTINATVTASSGATITNAAEITASSQIDLDSIVNNGANGEDDYDTATFTVTGVRTAGTPPSLNGICPPVNQILFDWATRTWTPSTATSQSQSYAVTGIGNVGFQVDTDGVYLANLEINGNNNGGIGETGLYQFLDYSNISQETTTVISLPTAVPGLQFRVFDIDFANNDFADRIVVTGTFDGNPVTPTLTNGISNYVAGNIAIGDTGAVNTTADGTIWVTFSSAVDTVTIRYGNHTTAPANPDGQAATIADITFCQPDTTLSVTKISQVISDPVNGTTNPKAIPGAILQYCILISNAGSASAEAIAATDTIPGNVTYNPASMQSGSNCGSASTAEDDDATGADESDPFGASVSGANLVATAATLGPADSYALTFQVTVD